VVFENLVCHDGRRLIAIWSYFHRTYVYYEIHLDYFHLLLYVRLLVPRRLNLDHYLCRNFDGDSIFLIVCRKSPLVVAKLLYNWFLGPVFVWSFLLISNDLTGNDKIFEHHFILWIYVPGKLYDVFVYWNYWICCHFLVYSQDLFTY